MQQRIRVNITRPLISTHKISNFSSKRKSVTSLLVPIQRSDLSTGSQALVHHRLEGLGARSHFAASSIKSRSICSRLALVQVHKYLSTIDLQASVPNPTSQLPESDPAVSVRGDFGVGHYPKIVGPHKTACLMCLFPVEVQKDTHSCTCPILLHICQELRVHRLPQSGSFDASLAETSVQ